MNAPASVLLSLSPRTRRLALEVAGRARSSARGMGYSEAWPGISNETMSNASIANAVGMGDYGSSIPYASSLGYTTNADGSYTLNGSGIVGAASHGNITQAQQLYGQLSNMLNNDIANGVITDTDGAQAVFAQAASDMQVAAANQTQNQAAWQALVNAVVARSQALDNDIGYTSSQGNVASTVAGQQADAAQGGVANTGAGLTNIIVGGPGGASIVNKDNLSAALNQSLGPGGTLKNPVTDALAGYQNVLIAAGVVLLIGAGLYIHGRGTRRSNRRPNRYLARKGARR